MVDFQSKEDIALSKLYLLLTKITYLLVLDTAQTIDEKNLTVKKLAPYRTGGRLPLGQTRAVRRG